MKANPGCPFCSNKQTVKIGLKKNKNRTLQRYKCKNCKKTFMIQPEKQKSKTYSLKTILDAISAYNLGTSLRKMSLKPPRQSRAGCKKFLRNFSAHSIFKTQIPSSTIHNWVKNINLPMNRLRNRIKNKPTHDIIIKKRFIHHKQPFLYQYHQIKLSFANRYPRLVCYLKNLEELLPKDIFKNSIRISEIAKETPTTMARTRRGMPKSDGVVRHFATIKKESSCDGELYVPHRGLSGVALSVESINVVGVSKKNNCNSQNNVVVGVSEKNNSITQKQNYAVELAKLAKAITEDNRKRHLIIENFMLINDTATIAVEVPVFLKENNKILTGHIDILQLRYNMLHILDYKPEPFNKEQAINQLILYRKALSNITKIPEKYFKLAFFNGNGYYEIIKPRF